MDDKKARSLTVLNGIRHGIKGGEYEHLLKEIEAGIAELEIVDWRVRIFRDYSKAPSPHIMQLDD